MIKPNEKLLDRTQKLPVITIAGQDWPIPKFAPKQNEVIVPIVLGMSSSLISAMSAPQSVRLQMLATVLSGENYRKLNDCIFLALERGHPELTRREYDEEWEVGTLEMVNAFITIAERTGLIKIAPAGTEAAKPGEEGAATSSQTGPQ